MRAVRILVLVILAGFAFALRADYGPNTKGNARLPGKKVKTMKVEIWSDVMCPFCYIGKRKFEQALKEFPHKNNIEIVWKSYQLSPGMKTDPGKNVNQYLAETKGLTLDYAKQMNDYVTKMAAESGLTYRMDKAVVANSFDAHRISHLAAKYGLQDQMEEALFKAYFTDGKNTADKTTLIALGKEIGLDETELRKTLETDAFAENVKADIKEAQTIGVNGVPFFVFDRKYAISGAQSSDAFLKTLEKAYQEWRKENNFIELEPGDSTGAVCSPDGKCE